VRAPDLLRPCLSRLSCLSSVSCLSPLAILLCICTYLHIKSRTVNNSFPGDVLDTAAPSACRRAVEVAMESRASRQVDAASRGPDNLHSRNDKRRFSLFTPSPDYLPSWTRLTPTRSSPTTTTTYPVTLAHHLTIRFRATIWIKLHLRLPASTESESERTVRGGSTAGGSRFNHTQGEDPSALGPVQAACPSQESFEPTPSASRSSVPQPLGPLQA
jgi:hypothetical protein